MTIYESIDEAAINLREAREYANGGEWSHVYSATNIQVVSVGYRNHLIVDMKKSLDTTK